MATSLVKVLIHVVFSTKHRRPFITETLRSELYPFMGGVVRRKGSAILVLGGMPDHVHLLLRLKSDSSLAELIRALKATSSKWVHEKPDGNPEFAWQMGYAGFSVSQSMVRAVTSYILNQEAHHARVGFEQELVETLKRHEVDFDPRDICD